MKMMCVEDLAEQPSQIAYQARDPQGYDECIYPADFKQAGEIIDDQLHDLLVRPLPPGCRLTAIFDSCHSATVMDLPYVVSSFHVPLLLSKTEW